jgi:hypothetical protein
MNIGVGVGVPGKWGNFGIRGLRNKDLRNVSPSEMDAKVLQSEAKTAK